MNNDHPPNTLGIFPRSWSEERAGRIPGNIPIWVGILSELTEFGIFFVAYFIAKYHYPELFASTALVGNFLKYVGLILVSYSS
jgi:cytochrome c oxidase subunit 3